MARIKRFLTGVFSVLLISSCSRSTVEEDVEEYCKCVENVKSRFELRNCIPIAKGIKERYGNSPEEAEYIIEKMKKCESPVN